jgi:hypothetical protein
MPKFEIQQELSMYTVKKDEKYILRGMLSPEGARAFPQMKPMDADLKHVIIFTRKHRLGF